VFRLKLTLNRRHRPANKLADVELHFDAHDVICRNCEGKGQAEDGSPCDGCNGNGAYPSPFAGLRIIGFAIWRKPNGERVVTFPGAKDPSGRGALLRPIADASATRELTEMILGMLADVERQIAEGQ
jgi:hypothetical protein